MKNDDEDRNYSSINFKSDFLVEEVNDETTTTQMTTKTLGKSKVRQQRHKRQPQPGREKIMTKATS